jgi:hypothetical protein
LRIAPWHRVHSLQEFYLAEREFPPRDDIDFDNRCTFARAQLGCVSSTAYLDLLGDAIVADPFHVLISGASAAEA